MGFPKDLISLKFLKKKIVIGDECLKNRMAVDLVWPLEEGVFRHSLLPPQPLDEDAEPAPAPIDAGREIEAARHLINHVVELAEVRPGQQINLVIGCPARASQADRQNLLAAANGLADRILIQSEPFLVAYGLNLFNNALIVDIGAGTMDMCRMSGTIPSDEDQRTLYKSGDYIDKLLHKLLQQKITDSPVSLDLARRLKEQYAFVYPQTETITADFQVDGKPKAYEITQELREASESILPDMVAAARELVVTYDPEFQADLRQNIFLAGGGSQIRGLGEALRSRLTELGPTKVSTVDDPIYAGAGGALQLAQDLPPSEWPTEKDNS
ncbi:MAG: hypothetical protein GKR89_15245 [Candidatus Latescibacteria bacterium]|nr:hypothetical protein [Candidatus Latescibacterota bacterium]